MDFKKYAKINMAIDTWGDKPKSQIDNSTVDEEIDAKIGDHLADPDAHLETGQSLQSHKASEIIDHLASSIVTDKLIDGCVTIDKFYEDKFYYKCSFESLDQWYLNIPDNDSGFFIGAGELTILAPNTVDKVVSLFNEIQSQSVGFDRDPWFQCFLLLTTDCDGYDFEITCGGGTSFETGTDCFGFFWDGSAGKLYARHVNSAGFVDTEIVGSWSEINIELRAEMYDAGQTIKYYIDDVLVATHSNADCSVDSNTVFQIGIKATSNFYGGSPTYLKQLIFSENNN